MSGRNDIFAAVFALSSGLTWLSSSGATLTLQDREQRARDWDRVQKPGLCQIEPDEDIQQQTNMPSKRLLSCEWWVYLDDGLDEGAVPSITVNNLLDAVEAKLAPLPGYDKQTLGGLVHHCWIGGKVLKIAGDLDGAGLVTIPIKILVP